MADGNDSKIEFPAEVNKVQTLADGGIRITFDLPETAIKQAAMLMACKVDGVYLVVTCREAYE